jgi:hypothetical protein
LGWFHRRKRYLSAMRSTYDEVIGAVGISWHAD